MTTALSTVVRTTIKTCGCGRTYTRDEWESLPFGGWMGDGDRDAQELRHCACRSTISVGVRRAELEAIVDGIPGAQVHYTKVGLDWRAVVTGLELPPHIGLGPTSADALAQVLTFAWRIGALK